MFYDVPWDRKEVRFWLSRHNPHSCANVLSKIITTNIIRSDEKEVEKRDSSRSEIFSGVLNKYFNQKAIVGSPA